ncbi:MAG: class I SAM-dependent methyltransferase [Acidimicrobiales bacterium]
MGASQQSREAIRQWESISSDQAAAMDTDGDFSKRWRLNDVIFDLLGDIAGSRVLDAGRGQGYLSRMMASRGAEVTSIEPAEPLFRHSLLMEQQLQQGIQLIQADLTTVWINQKFDAVVANMVLQSIDD